MPKITLFRLKKLVKNFKPKKKFLIILGCLILTFSALIFFETQINLHPLVSVWNFAHENIFSSSQEKTIELTNKRGFKIGSTGLLETVDGYQVKIETKRGLVEIEGLTNPGDIKAKIDNINQRGISTEVVSIRDGFSGYKKARVKLAKTGNSDIMAIVSCPDFNFEKFSCPSEWEPVRTTFTQTKDYIEFEVDHFSAYAGTSLTIFNVQSNLTQGDLWAVRFQTYGQDDLTIIPIKGTDYSEDLEFLGFYCGENRIDNVFDGEKVFIPGYQCEQESRIKNKALTPGQHFLQFIFGETVAEAHNFACNSGTLDTTCYVTTSQPVTDEETISGDGNLVIQSGGSLTCSVKENFYINMGGDITIEATTTVGIACSVQATSTNFTINTGGSINVNYKGYRGGYRDGNSSQHGEGKGGVGSTYGGGNGGDAYSSGGGGANGGNGGQGRRSGTYYAGGQSYGSLAGSTDLGAGGGGADSASYPGGNGGGAVKLNISGTLTVAGEIKARGQNYTAGESSHRLPGGGAGGSIWINAGTIAGAGTVSANGGNGYYYNATYWGGGGAGGRIAIYYTTSTFSDSYQAYGGTGYQNGGAGTIYKKQSSQTNFDLTIDNGTNVAAATTPLDANDHTIDNLIIDYSKLTLTGSITVVQSINDIDYSTVTISNNLTLPSNLNLSNNSTLSVVSLTVTNDVTVASGSNITHVALSTSGLEITAGGLDIQSGAYINVDYKGYRGGYKDGNTSYHGEGKGGVGSTYGGGNGTASTYSSGGGGANGGDGGHSGSGRSGGQAYGSLSEPTDLGAGGGGNNYGGRLTYGGNGGGAIKLNISGTLTINGEIKTSGQTGSGEQGGGGGAGGSIWINVGTVAGSSGTVSANGGNGQYESDNYYGGGGAGGRIAVYYTISTFSGSYQAYSGSGHACGGAGTIYKKQSSQINFDLTIDNGTNVAAANTPLGTNNYTIDNLIIDYSRPTITGSITVAQSINEIDYSTITVSDTLTILSNLTLSNNSTLIIPSLVVAYNITVSSGSNITHVALSTSGVEITAESLDIQSGGYINVDSKGYRGGYSDGNSSYNGEGKGGLGPTYGGGAGGVSYSSGGGGAYGGNGGQGDDGKAGGQAYGSLTQPTDLGAGGGGSKYVSQYAGGNGGGIVKLNISGVLIINGQIKAGGQSVTVGQTSCDPGGGAGGSIWINAGIISGLGTISANGGNGKYHEPTKWGGGGGGGRIAIYYKIDTFSGTKQVLGGTGYQAGFPGTMYLEQTEQISTSTISGVIRLGADRHTFYDGTNYWAFYIDVSGTGKVVYEKSANGINWVGSITEVGTSTAPYSSLGIWEDNTSIWVAYASSSLSYTRKITISDGTLGTEYSTTTSAIYHPQIIKDSDNYLWRKGETATSVFYAMRSTNSNDNSSWEAETNIGSDTSGYGHLMLLPISSAKVMALYNDYDGADYNLKYKIYDSGWGSASTTVSDCKDNTSSADWSSKHWFSAVADSSGHVHLIYVDSDDNDLNYTYFNGTSWSSPVEIYTGTVSYPSLSIDNNNNLYAFWIEDKNVKYKVSEGTSWGGSTATLKGNINSPSYLGSAYSDNSSVGVIWREGNSYDVIFDKVTVGTFPSSIWLKGGVWLKGGTWLK